MKFIFLVFRPLEYAFFLWFSLERRKNLTFTRNFSPVLGLGTNGEIVATRERKKKLRDGEYILDWHRCRKYVRSCSREGIRRLFFPGASWILGGFSFRKKWFLVPLGLTLYYLLLFHARSDRLRFSGGPVFFCLGSIWTQLGWYSGKLERYCGAIWYEEIWELVEVNHLWILSCQIDEIL